MYLSITALLPRTATRMGKWWLQSPQMGRLRVGGGLFIYLSASHLEVSFIFLDGFGGNGSLEIELWQKIFFFPLSQAKGSRGLTFAGWSLALCFCSASVLSGLLANSLGSRSSKVVQGNEFLSVISGASMADNAAVQSSISGVYGVNQKGNWEIGKLAPTVGSSGLTTVYLIRCIITCRTDIILYREPRLLDPFWKQRIASSSSSFFTVKDNYKLLILLTIVKRLPSHSSITPLKTHPAVIEELELCNGACACACACGVASTKSRIVISLLRHLDQIIGQIRTECTTLSHIPSSNGQTRCSEPNHEMKCTSDS